MHLNQILKNIIRNLDAVVALQTHSQFYNMEISIHLSCYLFSLIKSLLEACGTQHLEASASSFFCWVYFPPFGRQHIYEQKIKHNYLFQCLCICFHECKCAFLMVIVDLVCLPLVAFISRTLHNLLFSISPHAGVFLQTFHHVEHVMIKT